MAIAMLLVPTFAFAAWYNPLTWFDREVPTVTSVVSTSTPVNVVDPLQAQIDILSNEVADLTRENAELEREIISLAPAKPVVVESHDTTVQSPPVISSPSQETTSAPDMNCTSYENQKQAIIQQEIDDQNAAYHQAATSIAIQQDVASIDAKADAVLAHLNLEYHQCGD